MTFARDNCKICKEGEVPEDWECSWIVNVYKGQGDALERGSYRGIKHLDQVMKVIGRVSEKRIRNSVQLDEMQFAIKPWRGTTDDIFIRFADGIPKFRKSLNCIVRIK